MNTKRILVAGYALFVLVSFWKGIDVGREALFNLEEFALDMLKVLPFAFILIGLFSVWVPKRAVEERLGRESGLRGHLMAILLAGPFAGGLYVSLPLAAVLYEKGASLDVVLTFIGASTLVRIPMMIFEASFMGLKFTIVRVAVAIPLVIGSSYVLARLLRD